MKLTLTWVAQRAIDVSPGNFLASAVLADGVVLEASRGRDEFQCRGMVLPHQRVAGFGHQQS